MRSLRAMARATGKTPGPLLRRPTVPLDLRFYQTAFYDLSDSRGASMGGLLPIDLRAVLDYCDLQEITGRDERLFLVSLVRAQDRAFLAALREKGPRPAARSTEPGRVTVGDDVGD